MRIVRLEAENIKRIKAVQVTPTGELVVVGGKNDAGKSSLLDAIEMAMGGEARTPAQPVRRGAKSGRVVLDLGDLVVTRTFGAGGSRKLVVASKDGAHYPGPQAMLDRLYGALSFDPLAFERMEPRAQAETLRRLVGLDFSAQDAARQRLYEERTDQNKTVRTLQVQADALEEFLGVQAEEISIDAISREMLQAEEYRRLAAEADREVERARDRLARVVDEIAARHREQQELAAAMAKSQARLADFELMRTDALGDVDARQITAQAAAAVVPDVEAIRRRLSAADGTNQQVRSNRHRAAALKMLDDARRDSEALTARIEAVDRDKAGKLAAAQYPVPGLGIADEGVLLDGLPFEQASTSDRIRTSVAIGLAGNPQLKVLLVRDGSLLGPDKLALLGEMATAAGAQVWLEMLQEAPDGRTTVFIEDGSVRA